LLNYLEMHELTKVLEAAKKRSPKFEAMLAMMAYGGLRIGEARQIQLATVLRDGELLRMIHLPAIITKTKRSREVWIPDPLADILIRYLWVRTKSKVISDLLFPGPRGKPLGSSSIEKRLKTMTDPLLGRRITPHTLRHTFATILARSAPIRVVMEALGHTSLASTQIYLHVNKQDIKQASEVAFPRIDPPPKEPNYKLKNEVFKAFETAQIKL